jgi:hypothetical protein
MFSLTGIRRAHGTYILPLAMDTIIDPKFYETFLSSGHSDSLAIAESTLLHKYPNATGVLHRLARVDVGVVLDKRKDLDNVGSVLLKTMVVEFVLFVNDCCLSVFNLTIVN